MSGLDDLITMRKVEERDVLSLSFPRGSVGHGSVVEERRQDDGALSAVLGDEPVAVVHVRVVRSSVVIDPAPWIN